jgi:hypothetical protein
MDKAIKHNISLTTLILILTIATPASAKQYQMFYLGGQSNISGDNTNSLPSLGSSFLGLLSWAFRAAFPGQQVTRKLPPDLLDEISVPQRPTGVLALTHQHRKLRIINPRRFPQRQTP